MWLDYARATGQMVGDATPTSDGFMSAADKAKLDSISGVGGDDGARLRFAVIFANQPAPAAYACPGAQIGDTVVSVLAYGDTPTSAVTGAGSNLYNSFFETVISSPGYIGQNLPDGSTLNKPLLIVLKR